MRHSSQPALDRPDRWSASRSLVRHRRLLLAVCMVAAGIAAWAHQSGPGDCGPHATTSGGGLACLAIDDRDELQPAPDREVLLRTLGPRSGQRDVAYAGAGPGTADAPLGLVCDRSSAARRIEVLYGHAPGASRLAEVRAELEDHIRFAQLQYDFSAFVVGSKRAWVPRFVTEGKDEDCRVRITAVELPPGAIATQDIPYSTLVAAGYADRQRAYLVFVEDGPYCGMGTIETAFSGPDADHPDPAVNPNNNRSRPAYTRIDEPCWGLAEAHELGHNLGAVQQSAPHSTRGSHCTDGFDAMCYPDGSAGSSAYAETACPNELSYFALDCNNDDYYAPAPAAGSYLASHWNIVDNEWLVETFTDAAVHGVTIGPTGTRFDDVRLDDTFMRDIDDLARNGVTRGCNPPANTRFCPREMVTRGQMAAFLNRLLGLAPGDRRFRDVAADDTFRDDIAALAEAGITRGCNPPENTRFCPKDPVTREQMAAFLHRALQLQDGARTFRDVAPDSQYRGDIAALAEAGITRGCNPPENTRFCPKDHVTREQMAAFLNRTGLLTQ